MNQPLPNLQIRIHKINGVVTTFVQHDAAEIGRIFDNFHPGEIFDRDRLVITHGDSMTSLPVSRITRIDLITEQLKYPVFPPGVVDAVELSRSEYEALVRNPMMRKQWQHLDIQEGSLVSFLDLEMADGQQLLLTTEMRVDVQTSLLNTGWLPLKGPSLCFRMCAGGVSVLNLANLARLTYFPKPEHFLPDAWHASQFSSPPSIRVIGNPPIPLVLPPKTTNFQTK